MDSYTTLTGHSIEFDAPDAETRALLAKLNALLNDPNATTAEMIVAIYSPENPVMDREFVPGRGVVTPRVLEDPIYRVMADMLYRKRVAQEGIDIDALAARATLTVSEVAERLGVVTSAVRQAIAAGRLAAWWKNGKHFVDPAALEHFKLAPRGPTPAGERASTVPLSVCVGQDGEHTLRVKHAGELLDRETIAAVHGRDARERGRIVPWKRVVVRLTHKSGVLRAFVLVPSDTANEIRRDSLFISGHFAIEAESKNAKHADALWKVTAAE